MRGFLIEAAGGIEPPYGALQENVSSARFPTSTKCATGRCTSVAHWPALPSVWPVERLAGLVWGVMAEDSNNTNDDRGEKLARRIRWAMWGAAAVLVAVIAVMSVKTIYNNGVARSERQCRELGTKC